MWAILKSLIAQGILASTLVRTFGWLAWLLPLGFILKLVGWPILMVLGVLALPVLFLLLIVGLPIFVVLMIGGALMGLVAFLLTAGLALAKIIVPIALMVMVVRWFLRDEAPSETPAPDVTAPDATTA
jgi:hypothetical protein